jgi:hypothetical protein
MRGRRYHYRAPMGRSRISLRALAFINHFLENGGNGRAAATTAGYAHSSAAVTATRLLRDDRILDLLAAEICRRAPRGDEAKRRLLMSFRPEATHTRFSMLLSRHGGARVGGPSNAPVVLTNADDQALRDYVVRSKVYHHPEGISLTC